MKTVYYKNKIYLNCEQEMPMPTDYTGEDADWEYSIMLDAWLSGFPKDRVHDISPLEHWKDGDCLQIDKDFALLCDDETLKTIAVAIPADYKGTNPTVGIEYKDGAIIPASGKAGGVWVKASERLPDMEQQMHIKDNVGYKRLGNLFEDENKIVYLGIHATDGYESYVVEQKHFGHYEWLDESQSENPVEHTEIIKCPECGEIQQAKVLHTIPFGTYVHDCIKCEYTIMESEWTEVDMKEVIKELKVVYNYFGSHDKTLSDHLCFNIVGRTIKVIENLDTRHSTFALQEMQTEPIEEWEKPGTLENAAHNWVFETYGNRFSNNNNECGDNYLSFKAGAKWAVDKSLKGVNICSQCGCNKHREGFDQFECINCHLITKK